MKKANNEIQNNVIEIAHMNARLTTALENEQRLQKKVVEYAMIAEKNKVDHHQQSKTQHHA